MEISRGIGSGGRKVCVVYMTPEEALATAKSLIAQVLSNNPNSERFEKYTDEGEDFSIAVTPSVKEV